MQDKNEINPIEMTAKVLIIAALLFFILLVLNSCYSEKKAVKQVEKALDEYTGPTIAVVRNEYPCVDGDTTINNYLDSSAYVSERDSALLIALIGKLTVQQLMAKLMTLDDAVKMVCGDYAVVIDSLYAQNNRLNDIIRKGFKPVIEYREKIIQVEDMGRVFISEAAAKKYQELYETDHEWRIAREKKDKGNVVIRFPWWAVVLLGVSLIGYTYYKFKPNIKI